ncbi:MAG: hypothetical protein RBT70_09505 [Alphaproteobacteria bacterium]|jgi:hypothetical protein|nr:hypothetical protein [Alphaproteobacteria bacterium]
MPDVGSGATGDIKAAVTGLASILVMLFQAIAKAVASIAQGVLGSNNDDGSKLLGHLKQKRNKNKHKIKVMKGKLNQKKKKKLRLTPKTEKTNGTKPKGPKVKTPLLEESTAPRHKRDYTHTPNPNPATASPSDTNSRTATTREASHSKAIRESGKGYWGRSFKSEGMKRTTVPYAIRKEAKALSNAGILDLKTPSYLGLFQNDGRRMSATVEGMERSFNLNPAAVAETTVNPKSTGVLKAAFRGAGGILGRGLNGVYFLIAGGDAVAAFHNNDAIGLSKTTGGFFGSVIGGAGAGALAGSLTGPGALLTAVAGAVIGGVVGQEVAEKYCSVFTQKMMDFVKGKPSGTVEDKPKSDIDTKPTHTKSDFSNASSSARTTPFSILTP